MLPVTGYEERSGRCIDALAAITYRIAFNATLGIRSAYVDLNYVNATAGFLILQFKKKKKIWKLEFRIFFILIIFRYKLINLNLK